MNVHKIDTFSGHRDSVYTLIAGTLPEEFYSAGGDGFIVRWNLKNPDLGTLVARAGMSVYAMAFDAAANHLWVGQNFEGIQLIDPTTKSVSASLKITSSAIFDIKLNQGKALVALGDGVITVLDVGAFSVQKHLKVSEKSVRTIAVNPRKGVFAAGYSDANVGIFDLDSFQPVKLLSAHDNSVFSVRYSPDGRRLFTTGRDARIKIWDVESDYALLDEIPAHMYAVNDLIFSPDGTMFATCSMDKSIKLWDANALKLKKVIDRARHAGHGTSVNKLLWSGYHDYLISASDDRMISIWSVEV